MCEKTMRRIKKGSQKTRMREARRYHRIHRSSTPTSLNSDSSNSNSSRVQLINDTETQNRVLVDLALKTVTLLQRNKLIHDKIVELQRETTDFVATIMHQPENVRKFQEHLRMYKETLRAMELPDESDNMPMKLEPKF